MKPFSTAEAEGDPGKRLFKCCLSGLRTVMTKNVLDIWKMRFPILNHIGCHIPLAQDIITATAILHNLLVRWNANLPMWIYQMTLRMAGIFVLQQHVLGMLQLVLQCEYPLMKQ
jgi:hypothetical protein